MERLRERSGRGSVDPPACLREAKRVSPPGKIPVISVMARFANRPTQARLTESFGEGVPNPWEPGGGGRAASGFRTAVSAQMACANQVVISAFTFIRSLAGTQVPAQASWMK